MKRLLWFFLFVAVFAWFAKDGKSQNPPSSLTIGQTQISGGTNGDCLTVSGSVLGQGSCGGGGGTICGSLGSGQVAWGSGSNCIQGSSTFRTNGDGIFLGDASRPGAILLYDGSGGGFADTFSANPSEPLTQNNIITFPNISGRLAVTNGSLTDGDCVSITATALVDNGSPCSGMAPYTQSFTNQTTVALTHNFNTTYVLVSCYDTSSPPAWILYSTLQLTSANTATVTFASSQSGTCVVTTGHGSIVSAVGGVNNVSYSATPNFDLSQGWAQKITLTGNVTSSTTNNPYPGIRYTFEVCQDATGGRSFAWPTTFRGAMTIGVSAQASTCAVQTFLYDGGGYLAQGVGVLNE